MICKLNIYYLKIPWIWNNKRKVIHIETQRKRIQNQMKKRQHFSHLVYSFIHRFQGLSTVICIEIKLS